MTQLESRKNYAVGEVVEEYIQYRGPGRFRVQIRRDGVTADKSFRTLEAAKEFKTHTLSAVLGRQYVDARLAETTTLAHACEWGLAINPATGRANLDKGDANWKNHKARLTWWQTKSRFRSWMLAGQPKGGEVGGIHDFDLKKWVTEVLAVDVGDDVEDAEAAELELGRLEGYDGPVTVVKNQTIVHRLNTLSVLYRDWRQAHKLTEAQCPNPVVPSVRPPVKGFSREARRLREGEYEALLETAKASSRPWLPDAIVIAVESGMRQTELATLPWERTYLDEKHPYAHLIKTKNGEERKVPLSPVAVAAFRHLRQLAEEHNTKRQERIERSRTDGSLTKALATPTWDEPLPIDSGRGIIHAFRDGVADAQQRAREAGDPKWADIHDDLRWHDLRHEAVSRMFGETDMRAEEVMEIVGHLSKEMLKHYLKLRTPELGAKLPGAKAAEKVADAKAGSVKLNRGEVPMVRDADAKWVSFTKADEIIRAYAAKALRAALTELDALEAAAE